MIKHLHLCIIFLVISALTFSACKKDKDPSGSRKISFKIAMANLGHTTTYATAGGTWTSAVLNVDKFTYKVKLKGHHVYSDQFSGLWNVNLLTQNQEFWNITIPRKLVFDEIETTINLTPSAIHPPLTLKALFTLPNGIQLPAEFYFNDLATMDLTIDGIDASKRDEFLATVYLDVNDIFEYLDYSKLAKAANSEGKVVISSTSNVELYNQAKTALNESYYISVD